jgi:hypothetical protein
LSRDSPRQAGARTWLVIGISREYGLPQLGHAIHAAAGTAAHAVPALGGAVEWIVTLRRAAA